MLVPFNDLYALHSDIMSELNDAFVSVVANSAFVGGRFVDEFESNFAEKIQRKHCIGVGSGTAALFATFKMLGIADNDEVILPANTFFACAEAISLCGAKPVFVDNDEYYNIDVRKITSKITSNTKAVLAVHLYGQSCDISVIQKICTINNLALIEDCSQAHFAKFNDKTIGTFGKLAIFSFYPGKNMGALGDAGCIVTDDDDLAYKLRLFRNHGEYQKSKHQIIGFNTRLDGIQASMLNIKLKYIDGWNEKRRIAADHYSSLLKNCTFVELPKVMEYNKHTYHLFVIKAQKRNDLIAYLSKNNIGTGIHYPIALPSLSVYKNEGFTEDEFPNAISNQELILSLPIYPSISYQQIKFVCDKIIEFYS